MDFIKTPVRGMRDHLPQDMALRQNVLGIIRDTYARYGFTEIGTPAIEHIENLSNKQGGENEKLIFKIMKRGEELEKALSEGTDDLADSGLRYDLTVPLARYYAANSGSLPLPFKALQIGSVFRADRPQKGRFRQFTQCDIDIIGEDSIMAEIELITATSDALSRILSTVGITTFTVHIGDRHILRAMARYAGFSEDDFDDVFITLDKYDKIGVDGIEKELADKGYDTEAIARYAAIFKTPVEGKTCREYCRFLLGEYLDEKYADNIDTIIQCVRQTAGENVNLVFDPTLVRGMSYYTGTIFECTLDGYGFSVAGGGRYDTMIGHYSGNDVSACGFSIGFERIITVLSDHKDALTQETPVKYAFLVQSGANSDTILNTFRQARELRDAGRIVTVQAMRRNLKRQISDLEAAGYTQIAKVYKD